MDSVWTKSTKLPEFKKLESNIKTDILIIGGGLCGILCAYFLKQSGMDYTLVEANKICSGITKNTTAKITSQHGLIYNKLIKQIGADNAKKYLEINEHAIKKYKEMCANIDCDFENKDAYTYSTTSKENILKEVAALNSIGYKAKFTEKIELPFTIKGAIKFENQAQFNPLKFIREIVKDLNIYENTFIKEIKNNVALADNASISAKKIIVTTHFPFINMHGSYFMKMYQERSYVIGLQNAQNVEGMYIDEQENGLSFRNYKDLLLLGGGGHRTGKKGGNWEVLREFKKTYYPNSKEKYAWSTQDCMTLDKIPYIGKYSNNTPNLYVATGFNKWGMTTSMYAAIILVDLLKNKKNKYAPIFNPSRNIIKPQLFINGYEYIIDLVNISKKRCPHMGCQLIWNNAEHTWDCPCHGSRFEKNGKLIDNPAMKSLNEK